MKIIKLACLNMKSLLLGTVSILLLGGCATTTNSNVAEVPNGLSAEEFHAKMAEFEQMKPSLQRLAALEPELKALISQLTQIAEAAEIQETQSAALVASESNRPPVKKSQSKLKAKDVAVEQLTLNTVQNTPRANVNVSETANKHTSPLNEKIIENVSRNGQYTLQLTAVTDKNKLAESWRTLQSSYTPELDDLQAIYQEVDLSGVTFYRIKAGFYDTQQQAKESCKILKKMGANCIVSNQVGMRVI